MSSPHTHNHQPGMQHSDHARAEKTKTEHVDTGHDNHHDHASRADHEGHAGHGAHAGNGDHGAMFKNKFCLSLILSIPVIFFSPMFADLLGYTAPDFLGAQWIAPVLGTVIYIYGGMPFLTGGWSELKSRQPGMMLLIAMAITVAFVASWATSLGIGGFMLGFRWELALLVVVIMLLGHWVEKRALGTASGALDALADLLPAGADKITEDGTLTVPISTLRFGGIVLVRSGARVPADGRIVEGTAEFDESMITGFTVSVTA